MMECLIWATSVPVPFLIWRLSDDMLSIVKNHLLLLHCTYVTILFVPERTVLLKMKHSQNSVLFIVNLKDLPVDAKGREVSKDFYHIW